MLNATDAEEIPAPIPCQMADGGAPQVDAGTRHISRGSAPDDPTYSGQKVMTSLSGAIGASLSSWLSLYSVCPLSGQRFLMITP